MHDPFCDQADILKQFSTEGPAVSSRQWWPRQGSVTGSRGKDTHMATGDLKCPKRNRSGGFEMFEAEQKSNIYIYIYIYIHMYLWGCINTHINILQMQHQGTQTK